MRPNDGRGGNGTPRRAVPVANKFAPNPGLHLAFGARMDQDSTVSPTTLYRRLGGRPRLLHLLKHFYADVRQHRVIGPIFIAQITDWPAHLEKIADFWSNVTGGPVRYEGPMPQKHFPLGLEEQHFATWLDLWQRQCRAQLPPAEAAELIAAAETIGQRLRALVAQQRPGGRGGHGR